MITTARQAGLAEHGVLKANLDVVFGAWFKQAGGVRLRGLSALATG
jgi:hypothetical protein